mmetsp:Transcript_16595/g.56592  ORF Transcript_16595/g.56592 Transcript_16595/m.56592 type:complete len:105 (+) Transcript_16595:235-549(+)
MQELKAALPDVEVLAFPSLEFGGQEYGDAGKVKDFVAQYGTPCRLMETGPINGSPVFEALKAATDGAPVTWNFAAKWVVDKDGTVVKRSKALPMELADDLKAAM